MVNGRMFRFRLTHMGDDFIHGGYHGDGDDSNDDGDTANISTVLNTVRLFRVTSTRRFPSRG